MCNQVKPVGGVGDEKQDSLDKHSYFVASYNITGEAQSYLLRAKVSEDVSSGRNETAIE